MSQVEQTLGEKSNSINLVQAMVLDPTVRKIVDFDRTLFDTSALHRQAVEEGARAVGVACNITPDFGKEQLRGKSDIEIMEIVLYEFGGITDKLIIEKALQIKSEILQNLAELTVPLPIEGVENFVRKLRNTQQRAGIASQSPKGFISAILQRTLVDGIPITDVFTPFAIVGSEVVSRAERRLGREIAKPQSDTIIHSAKRLDRKAQQQILYIGDTVIDAQAGQQISGLTVIVNADFKMRKKIQNDYPNTVVIGSLEEVLYAA